MASHSSFPEWGASLHSGKINGITMRWADTAHTKEEAARPVVLMMHGWPESWWSYRHQLKAVHEAGFRGIAPDMRGYGGTDAPSCTTHYTAYVLAADMLALMSHLGRSKVCLVGHDHGANTGWHLAQLYPESFVCYCALSVPCQIMDRSGDREAPLTMLRGVFGDETKPDTQPKFFYQLHHCLPQAADDYGQDTRGCLMVLYGDREEGAAPAPVDSPLLYVNGKSEPMWRRAPQPTKLLPWISQSEFDYYVNEFEVNGWEGGLHWYKVMDTNYHAMPQLEGKTLKQPCAFIGGTLDVVTTMAGGMEKIKRNLSELCQGGVKVTFVEGAGHWIQQERPDVVNREILQFAESHRALFATGGVTPSRL